MRVQILIAILICLAMAVKAETTSGKDFLEVFSELKVNGEPIICD